MPWLPYGEAVPLNLRLEPPQPIPCLPPACCCAFKLSEIVVSLPSDSLPNMATIMPTDALSLPVASSRRSLGCGALRLGDEAESERQLDPSVSRRNARSVVASTRTRA